MSDTSENDRAMQVGLLMEAAQAQQRLGQESLERLQAHLRDLDTVVRDEIQRTLTEVLADLAGETARAVKALRGLRRAADLRLLVWSVLVTAASAAAATGTMRWLAPSAKQIAALQAQRADLVADLARLKAAGAAMDLRRCGPHRRLCVRVDRRGPAYGAHGDYRLIEAP